MVRRVRHASLRSSAQRAFGREKWISTKEAAVRLYDFESTGLLPRAVTGRAGLTSFAWFIRSEPLAFACPSPHEHCNDAVRWVLNFRGFRGVDAGRT
jgi:hypothetical protein